ncbi:IS3 family transposase [Piscirickettsia salmonis]|uniref:IS3 family transposase n=2 Tax=Piscirickettsia salmonis TaxID=1238 RepID=UPI0012BA1398|nr:IS3 family transposase [Piscirickettsia salmonis]
MSGNKACKICSIGRSVYRYQPKKQVADTEIKKVLTDLAKVHHRWGFNKMMAKIKQNYAWNHKRVYRVYCELKGTVAKNYSEFQKGYFLVLATLELSS